MKWNNHFTRIQQFTNLILKFLFFIINNNTFYILINLNFSGVGIAPSDPMADSKRVHGDENRSAFLDTDALKANMLLAALDGRIQIIGENGKSAPIEVADVPERVKAALEAKDMDKAYALLLAECAK